VLSQHSKSHHYADIAQLAERQISNLNVAGSMPVVRSNSMPSG
jgi:hypothetical protein